MKSCAECEALVSKLAERPPSPLIVVDSPLPDPVPQPSPRLAGIEAELGGLLGSQLEPGEFDSGPAYSHSTGIDYQGPELAWI